MPRGFTWYPFQEKALQAPIDWYMQGKSKSVISVATGGGKTLIGGGIIEEFLARSSYAMFLVPRLDLAEQTVNKFADHFFDRSDIGLIQGKNNELGKWITVASKDTIDSNYRLEMYLDSIRWRKCDLMIIDECHYSVTDQYRKLIDALLAPNGMLVGLSATPYRADGQSLLKIFPDGLCYLKDIWELIRDHYLVDLESYDIDMGFDPDNLYIKGTNDRERVMDLVKATIRYQKAYDAWYQMARTKRTLVFADSLADVQGFYDFFTSKGVRCAVVTGKTEERGSIYKAFKAGEIQMVINYGVMTTGNDIEEIECIILGRKTENLGLLTQMIGRGLRLAPWIEKEKCLVLNLTGKQYTLMMFKTLFGSISDHIASVRKVIQEKQKEEERQFEEYEKVARAKLQASVQLGGVTAYKSDMLLGTGWREHPVTHDWEKIWMFKDKEHRLVVEKQFAGGYLPVHYDARGRREQLSQELMSLPDAQRLCQTVSVEKEQKLKQSVPSAEHKKTPITERQFNSLVQRRFPIKPKGWRRGDPPRLLTPEEKKRIMAKMSYNDYLEMEAHWKLCNKSPFSKEHGNIGFYEDSGLYKSPPVKKR